MIVNVLSLLALGQLALGDGQLLAGRACLLLIAPIAAIVAPWTIVRSRHRQSAEQEFAAWYRVPPGYELVFHDGWWLVQPQENNEPGKAGQFKSSVEPQEPSTPQSS